MTSAERLLTWLLRLSGVLLLLALGAVVMPTAWMADIHEWIGLGEFPAAPLTEYLTRSISALYALHGGLAIVLARDIRRFAPIIAYLGWVSVTFGAAMVAIDVSAPMTRGWTIFEGPSIVLLGLAILMLLRRVDLSAPGHQQPGGCRP